jgi:hypothetical protein
MHPPLDVGLVGRRPTIGRQAVLVLVRGGVEPVVRQSLIAGAMVVDVPAGVQSFGFLPSVQRQISLRWLTRASRAACLRLAWAVVNPAQSVIARSVPYSSP